MKYLQNLNVNKNSSESDNQNCDFHSSWINLNIICTYLHLITLMMITFWNPEVSLKSVNMLLWSVYYKFNKINISPVISALACGGKELIPKFEVLAESSWIVWLRRHWSTRLIVYSLFHPSHTPIIKVNYRPALAVTALFYLTSLLFWC